VSQSAGAPYQDRLLALPAFLAKGGRPGPGAALERKQAAITNDDIVAGLELTGHFLETRVLGPRGEAMPDARVRLRELIARHASAQKPGAVGH
jgi:DNA repair protein RecO (recombination protein O)